MRIEAAKIGETILDDVDIDADFHHVQSSDGGRDVNREARILKL